MGALSHLLSLLNIKVIKIYFPLQKQLLEETVTGTEMHMNETLNYIYAKKRMKRLIK